MRRSCLFLILVAVLTASPSAASEYLLSPSEDAYVYSGEPGVNVGSQFVIVTEYDQPGGGTQKFAYLKFDLTGIPQNEVITAASLYLCQLGLANKGDGLGTGVYRIASDNWNETRITWVNQPAESGTLLGTRYLGNAEGWNQWNLFEIPGWDPGADQDDGVLSLRLTEGQAGVLETHYFYSRDYTSYALRPYLVVTTAPVPIPGALWLLGSGLLGLVALRRRFK